MSTTVAQGETLHLCLMLAGVADHTASDVEWYTSLLRFLFLDLLIRFLLVLLVLVRKAGNPQTALTWVILLLGLPVAGLVLYLLFGEARFGYFRRKRHAEAIQRVDRPGGRADTNPASTWECAAVGMVGRRPPQASSAAPRIFGRNHQ